MEEYMVVAVFFEGISNVLIIVLYQKKTISKDINIYRIS